jgi:hypothetical protein
VIALARPVLFALVLGGAGLVRADEPAAPPWSFMRLTEGECAWRNVDWLPSFGDAVARARAEGRPIFLWAMNGHPLACV